MNRRQMLAHASALAAGTTVVPFYTDVATFGATGDGVTDDAAAIQAALDHVGARGGGRVQLSPPKVHYRITRGLTLPSYVVLEGPTPVRYPFNASNQGACALVADFADARQWMVEPATRSGGRTIPFDQLVSDALPDDVTYNCGVRNLLLTSRGKVPFGGIRMHGSPGAIVDGVSIDRVGCGLLVNYSFGGTFRAQVHSLYYGVAVWDDANANIFDIYCAHSVPWPRTVPSAYRLPFMAQMGGHFADTLKLSTDDHIARPYGVLCGSVRSTSIDNVFDMVVERFPGAIFLFNAYALDIRRCYIEADHDQMVCAITASRSRFGIQALHAYLSGTGMIFDLGIDVLARVFASGILDVAGFGNPPFDDGSSLMILEGVDLAMPGAPLQPGIRYVAKQVPWMWLVLQSGWRADGDERPAVRLDPWSHRVELAGTMTGGRDGICFVLPENCRPTRRGRYMVAGGRLSIDPDGVVRLAGAETMVSLDGISFPRW